MIPLMNKLESITILLMFFALCLSLSRKRKREEKRRKELLKNINERVKK